MKISVLGLLALVTMCRCEELVESSGWFKSIADKTKNGLNKMREAISPTPTVTEPQSKLAEGMDAVKGALDGLQSGGQESAEKASSSTKDVAGKTGSTVKDAMSAGKDKLSSAGAGVQSTVDSAKEGMKDLGHQAQAAAKKAADSATSASKSAKGAVKKEAADAAGADAADAIGLDKAMDAAAKSNKHDAAKAAEKATEEF